MSARLFAALAARPADERVLCGERRSWRAGELLREIDALAERLAGCPVLALLADNGPEWVIADLAALRSGTVVLPLPGFFSRAQMIHALDRCGADTIATDQPERVLGLDLGFALAETRRGMSWLRRVAAPGSWPTGTAKVSFTSGSTGAAKGVCLSAPGLVDTAEALTKVLAQIPIDRHLAVLPLALLLENSAGVYAPLLRGAQIHLPGLARLGWQGMSGFAPQALQQAVGERRPASLILVPEVLKAWTRHLAAQRLRAPDSLRFVAVGGARVDGRLLAEARQLGIPAYQGYGLTECASVVCLNRPGDDGDDAGRPLPHVGVSVEDGEIRVTTRAFLGYVGDEASPRARAGFLTGDLGRLAANGHIELSGRRSTVLISSFGRNISPEWVESALLAQPEIAQAIVAGDARSALSAIVVAPPQATPAAVDAAITRTNAALPDYARIRRWLAAAPFTPANGLATGNGRPLRAAILAQYAAALAALYQEEDYAVL